MVLRLFKVGDQEVALLQLDCISTSPDSDFLLLIRVQASNRGNLDTRPKDIAPSQIGKGQKAMKKIALLISLAALLVGSTSVLYAGSSIYGVSGLIETPDDSIVASNSLALNANYVSDISDRGDVKLNTYGGALGLFPKFEVSAAAIDTDVLGTKTRGLLNAKYQFLSESLEKPSVTVGIVDVAGQLDKINGEIDNTSMFIVFGKNISSMAEGISGEVSKPLHGTLGFGTGLYKGVFAGLNWSAAPKFNVLVEYLSNGIRQESTVSAAVHFNAVPGLALEVGTLAFEGVYAGANYSLSTF